MTKKLIDSITDEKWEELVKTRQKGIDIGSCTDPADWDTAEKAITNMYRRMGWNDEITFIRADSPLHVQKILQKDFGAKKGSVVGTSLWGQMDTHWITHLEFLLTIPGIEADKDKVELLGLWSDIAKSIGWWYVVNETTCIMCDRPEIVLWDDNGFLHCEDGPAVKYRDGWDMYSYGGVRIPRNLTWIIDSPEKITVDDIKKQHDNVEIRRIMIELMGVSKYLDQTKASIVAMDSVHVFADGTDDTMPRALMRDDENRQYLVGTDGSTRRVYYMEVDPDVTTCAEAHESISPVDEECIIGNS